MTSIATATSIRNIVRPIPRKSLVSRKRPLQPLLQRHAKLTSRVRAIFCVGLSANASALHIGVGRLRSIERRPVDRRALWHHSATLNLHALPLKCIGATGGARTHKATGLEPAWCANSQLSHRRVLAIPGGLEPPTSRFGGGCAIHLRYGINVGSVSCVRLLASRAMLHGLYGFRNAFWSAHLW